MLKCLYYIHFLLLIICAFCLLVNCGFHKKFIFNVPNLFLLSESASGFSSVRAPFFWPLWICLFYHAKLLQCRRKKTKYGNVVNPLYLEPFSSKWNYGLSCCNWGCFPLLVWNRVLKKEEFQLSIPSSSICADTRRCLQSLPPTLACVFLQIRSRGVTQRRQQLGGVWGASCRNAALTLVLIRRGRMAGN